MITCPKCSASLPDWAQSCQFCQTDVRKVARPVAAKIDRGPLLAVPQWVWGAYYALAGYFVLKGGYDIYTAFAITHQRVLGEEVGFGFLSVVAIIVGTFNLVLGFGLMFQVQVLRNVANFILGIQILFGIVGIVFTLPGIMLSGVFGVLSVVVQLLQIGAACFMVFLLGETDKTAPNI